MPFINCADASIDAYVPDASMPWNRQRAIHLMRRISFGAPPSTIDSAVSNSAVALVNNLVDQAVAMPLLEEPEWAYWQISDYDPDPDIRNGQIIDQVLGLTGQWVIDMKRNGLRDRMSWFWHNHFVTRLEDYGCPSWMYQYHKLLQKHALGNFKEFVREMGITPAMLVFLNNIQNTQFEINENYARELYELFTLGVDNGYTQQDIEETARAITGWSGLDVNDLCGEVEFLPVLWDSGQKTIFGQTGNWGYDDVVDILFQQRGKEISEYICGKLYTHFVNPKVDELIVEQLAMTFRANNYELAPVIKQMFSSAHFYDEANIGTVIPGHIELFLTFICETGFDIDDELLVAIAYSAGDFDQSIFNPTNVAGWPGNRNWVTSASLPYRFNGIAQIMGFYYNAAGESLEPLRDFIKSIVDPNETDPKIVAVAMVNYMLPKGLQFPIEYEEAIAVFKADVPENYYTDGIWNLDWEYVPLQVYLLINHIAQLPEFQLK